MRNAVDKVYIGQHIFYFQCSKFLYLLRCYTLKISDMDNST